MFTILILAAYIHLADPIVYVDGGEVGACSNCTTDYQCEVLCARGEL